MATATPAPLLTHSDEALAASTTQELWRLLVRAEDRAPRNLIDECARRGDEIIDLAADLLDKAYFWDDDVGGGEWWLRLHAVMILGLVEGPRAGALVVRYLERIDAAGDEDLQEWLAGYWPALFANKPDESVTALAAFANDRARGWFARMDALEVMLARAARTGGEALEAALRTLAAVAFDEDEDFQLRSLAGSRLLDFPRPENRARLEKLADAQSGEYPVFDRTSVAEAYAARGKAVQRDRFDDPWRFYAADEIGARQQRWAQEAEARSRVVWDEPGESYVRQAPKVGRNDPCPCGSGKKFKKCCMSA
jgi:hypothetical protein